MKKGHHLYIVFNPMMNQAQDYQSQAHEFYYQLKQKVQTQDPNESFMYWGKIGLNPAHIDFESLNKVIEQNKICGHDTHLYITDYHQFWVAKVESVHESIVGQNHTLSFYDDKNVDIWFKISDMDMVSGEFEETSYYLSNLFVDNQFHENKIESINPYLGGLSFPMVVQDHINDTYFKRIHFEDSLKILKSNPMIENFHGTRDLKNHFKSFVIPPQVFWKLSGHVKNELYDVEMKLASDNNSIENLRQTIHSYLRILESVLNDTVGEVFKEYFGHCLYIDQDGQHISDRLQINYVKVNEFKGNISLGVFEKLNSELQKFGNISLEYSDSKHAKLIDYYLNDLLTFFKDFELVALRKCLQKGSEFNTSKSFVYEIRNQILGVGCTGVINDIMSLFHAEQVSYQLKQTA